MNSIREWIARHRAPREPSYDAGSIAHTPTAKHGRCAVCGADLVDANEGDLCSLRCALIVVERQERAE